MTEQLGFANRDIKEEVIVLAIRMHVFEGE